MERKENCPICACSDAMVQDDFGGKICQCQNCGRFLLTGQAGVNLQEATKKDRAVLSHGIWRRQQDEGLFEVTSFVVEAAKKQDLPIPAQQLDNLVLYVGDKSRDTPGEGSRTERENLRAKAGVILTTDVIFAEKMGQECGLVETRASGGVVLRLTFKGWQRYEELKKGKAGGRTAFMAMPFGIDEVTVIVENIFRSAVKETGFNLKRVDDDPKAGVIDNKIRVDIRMCRFLIADLTCCNRGAYWEAGYAEGLGKPVIYTCNKHYFEQEKTHFDTNHCTTIVWDPGDPDAAAKNLKATIRATLPFEAKLPAEDEVNR